MKNFFSQIQLSKFFDKQYIFQDGQNPEGLYRYSTILFGLMIILALIIKLFIKSKNEVYQKFKNKLLYLFFTVGLVGLLWVFCRYEGIGFLGSRIIILLLAICLILWSLYIVWFWKIILPKETKKMIEQERFQKYLPKKKIIRNNK